MQSFFSPRSKRMVSRPVARTLNTLNLLGPSFLFLAVLLLAIAKWGEWAPEEDRVIVSLAGILVALALVIRIVWGIAIARIRRNTKPET
jgi:hypothetical protein